MELVHLGTGHALYLEFFKLLLIFMFIIFCVSSAPALYFNYNGEGCQDLLLRAQKPYCTNSFIMTLSIANARDNPNSLEIEYFLNLIAIILGIVFLVYTRVRLRKLEIKMDVNSLTPSDYTLEFLGLPLEKDDTCTDEGLKNFVEGFGNETNKVEVKAIVRGYNIKEYIKLK